MCLLGDVYAVKWRQRCFCPCAEIRILLKHVRPQAQKMQIALHALSAASPEFFMVDKHVVMAFLRESDGKFRDIVYAFYQQTRDSC